MSRLLVLIVSLTVTQAPIPCPHTHAGLSTAALVEHLARCHGGHDEDHEHWHWHLVWIGQAAPVDPEIRSPALPPCESVRLPGADCVLVDWHFAAALATSSGQTLANHPPPLDSPAFNQREAYKRLGVLLI
jgi:hypothetical protein